MLEVSNPYFIKIIFVSFLLIWYSHMNGKSIIRYVAVSGEKYYSKQGLHYPVVSIYFTEKNKDKPLNITEFNERASLYNL